MIWRLILDGEYSGAQNMARDEALLLTQSRDATCRDFASQFSDSSAPESKAMLSDAQRLVATSRVSTPVLRFYSWNPACVSIGRLQKNFAPSPNFDFVRRPTGGRAVLHQHEITYCAVLHREHLPRESRSVLGAYHWLSAGFIEGLKTLGVRAELATKSASRSTPGAVNGATNCFQNAAQCDFVADGRKLIGASQCRKNDVILQHGSILLEVDPGAWHQAMGGANGEFSQEPLMEKSVSLRALGVLQTRDEIIRALCAGMESMWNIEFENARFSREELEKADFLCAQKYCLSAWNENGIDAAGI